MTAETPAAGATTTRIGWIAAWTLLALIHLVLVFSFLPAKAVFSEQPLVDVDYPLHYYQVDRAVKAFRQSGHLWSWDPLQLAGQPAGTVEDMSSKTVVLFVLALTSLGVNQGLAFNLFALFVHLLVPWLALGAARCFGLRGKAALILAVLWVLLWHFDSFIHWCWYCGMLSWTLSSALAVLVVGLVYRVLQLLDRQRAAVGWWLAVALGCAAIGLLHPLAMAVVALPCGAMYLAAFRRGSAWTLPALRVHWLVATCIAAATAAALLWLLPARSVWRYVISSDYFLRPTPWYFLYDLFELHINGGLTGPTVQTLVRFLCFVAGAVSLWRWRRERDPRYLPLLVLVASNVAIAYLGRYLWLTSTAQPYRAIVPAAFAAAVPASVLLAELFSRPVLRSLSPLGAAVLVICALLLTPRVVRTFVYFFPGLTPISFIGRPDHPVNTVLGSSWKRMSDGGPPRAFRDAASWLRIHHQGRGRVLVQDAELGEYLAGHTDLPIIGGFAYRPLQHGDANLWQYEAKLTQSDAELREYFERYAVGFVVMRKVHWRFENKKRLLQFRQAFDGLDVRIFETTITPNYLLRGSGSVARQEVNRIFVEGSSGTEAVLRFHWLDSLRCRPDCTVERAEVAGDRVGFLRVPRPPARFEIYNSYVFPR